MKKTAAAATNTNAVVPFGNGAAEGSGSPSARMGQATAAAKSGTSR